MDTLSGTAPPVPPKATVWPPLTAQRLRDLVRRVDPVYVAALLHGAAVYHQYDLAAAALRANPDGWGTTFPIVSDDSVTFVRVSRVGDGTELVGALICLFADRATRDRLASVRPARIAHPIILLCEEEFAGCGVGVPDIDDPVALARLITEGL